MTSSKDRSAKLGLRCCYFLSNIHRKHDELVKTTFCFLKMIMAEVILKTLPAKKKKRFSAKCSLSCNAFSTELR